MPDFKTYDKQYIENTYARFDVAIVKGKGSYLFDENGKKYIDFNSGIAVNTFGVSDKKWKAAVKKQIGLIQHASNLYYTEPCTLLAKALCERTGAEKVFFSNSGAEANECAIKCARLWGETNKGKDYYNIITFDNGFHGRTVTTLAATAQGIFHEHFYPFTDGFLYADSGDIVSVKKLVKENKCAAIMLEFIQGEGGVLPMDKGFIEEIKSLCEKENLLFIADEVQTGNGRTGALYAYSKYGVVPDILTTAKGLAGGLPLGATLFFGKSAGTLKAGMHGSTFGGNPVCCAAALSNLKRIDDKLLKEVNDKSDYILKELSGADGVVSISGTGLMLGIEVKCDAGKVIAACIEKGVLPIKAKNKIRLLPPLNITWGALRSGVETIKQAIKESL